VNDVAHERIEELLAADALDGLDEQGRRDLERALEGHDPECPECARLRAAYADVAASLGMSLDPLPVGDAAEERLVAVARAGAAGRVAPLRPRRRTLRVVTVAIGAAACLLVAGVVGYSIRPSGERQMVDAFTSQGNVHTAEMSSGSTKLTVYYRPGQQAALVSGTGFADPPAGHVYEVWYRPAGSLKMTPACTFTPANGSIVAPAVLEPGFTALTVSVEPGYETTPTGPVVLSGSVSASPSP